MDPAFWRARWAEQRIGFHEGAPNAMLEAHAGRLDDRRRVLVPLCGKSEDLAFLAARGHAVVGIELVESAVQAFFAEHGLVPTIDGATYSAGDVSVIASDFFATTPALVGPIDAVYDRAAIIALPAELRPRYIAQLAQLAPGAPTLTIALDYDESLFAGPPFSVDDAELRRYYPDAELLATGPNRSGRIAQLGIPSTVRCYMSSAGAKVA
jgi:thiopurine S-methyltransferase